MTSESKYHFSKDHLWTLAETDGTFIAGISDHAQQLLGDIVYVESPAPGTKLQAGQVCGFVESVKTASDLHAPISGEVLAVNSAIAENPELLNDEAETTWIFRFRANDPNDVTTLMDKDTYQKTLD
ncbi:MAG TPA: glycine cleavage system protein GcvH [Methylophilaceae bacterium]|jgi:glycine cleavage system H protein